MCWQLCVLLSWGVVVGAKGSTDLALLKPTRQSSLGDPADSSSKAVDGNMNPAYHHESCTRTRNETNPWWMVDLQRSSIINEVIITSRGDCCGGQLKDVFIGVSEQFSQVRTSQNTFSYPVCGHVKQPFTRGETRKIKCGNPKAGRYVIIRIRGEHKVLTLCEVKVLGVSRNLAFHKPTRQSSLLHSAGKPKNAVDGNADPNYDRHTCTHTNKETNPWWMVDMLTFYVVEKVIITNRGDCCEARLHNVQIGVSETFSPNDMKKNAFPYPLCAHISEALGKGETRHVKCKNGIGGRYVIIRLPGSNKILTLCEVKVVGALSSIWIKASPRPVGEGDDTTLSCGVIKAENVSYVYSWTLTHAGKTSLLLTSSTSMKIIKAKPRDAGLYGCKAHNNRNEEYATLFLNVHYAPRNIHLCEHTQTYMPGEKIQCVADAFPPVHSYQWLAIGSNVGFLPGSVLTLNSSMAGLSTFRCVAENNVLGNIRRHYKDFYIKLELTSSNVTVKQSPHIDTVDGHTVTNSSSLPASLSFIVVGAMIGCALLIIGTFIIVVVVLYGKWRSALQLGHQKARNKIDVPKREYVDQAETADYRNNMYEPLHFRDGSPT